MSIPPHPEPQQTSLKPSPALRPPPRTWDLQTGAALSTLTGAQAEQQRQSTRVWAGQASDTAIIIKCDDGEVLEVLALPPTSAGGAPGSPSLLGTVFVGPPFTADGSSVCLRTRVKRLVFFTKGSKRFMVYELNL